MEQRPRKIDKTPFPAAVEVAFDLIKDVKNVLKFAAPNLPEEVKDKLYDRLREVTSMNFVDPESEKLEPDFKSSVPGLREEGVRRFMKEKMIGLLSDRELFIQSDGNPVPEDARMDFINSISK